MPSIIEAAEARRAGVRSAVDRPAQRRNALEAGSTPGVRCAAKIELRDAPLADVGGPLTFTGYASVTKRGYDMFDMFGPYTEVVAAGAFDQTLAQPGLDVPLVLAHDPLRRMARTLNGTLALSVDDTGLRTEARLDPADPDVAYIAPKLRSGLIDEMSFRFYITSGQWSPDFTEYRIESVDMHRGDVAIVGYGANPYTSSELREALKRISHKRALDPADVNVITQALGWLTAIDSIVDEGQEALAAYLKVPNPDADDDAAAELAAVVPTISRAVARITDDELEPRRSRFSR